eukprot:SAG11_NODE_1004_length_6210_cov_14.226150_8_plen_164_part_00
MALQTLWCAACAMPKRRLRRRRFLSTVSLATAMEQWKGCFAEECQTCILYYTKACHIAHRASNHATGIQACDYMVTIAPKVLNSLRQVPAMGMNAFCNLRPNLLSPVYLSSCQKLKHAPAEWRYFFASGARGEHHRPRQPPSQGFVAVSHNFRPSLGAPSQRA